MATAVRRGLGSGRQNPGPRTGVEIGWMFKVDYSTVSQGGDGQVNVFRQSQNSVQLKWK